MATTGTIALEKLQAGLEITRGTAIAATRKIYGERGNAWFDLSVQRETLAENMGSYVEFYRFVDTAVQGKLKPTRVSSKAAKKPAKRSTTRKSYASTSRGSTSGTARRGHG